MNKNSMMLLLLMVAALMGCNAGSNGAISGSNNNSGPQIAILKQCVNKPPLESTFYQAIFNPPSAKIPHAINRNTFAFGDMDGGFARTMLAGIRAGMITLNESDLNTLCSMLRQERLALGTESAAFIQFQESIAINQQQQELVNNASYSAPASQVIYIGDILHDRLNNNQLALALLLKKLHQYGAIFIYGNHDSYSDAQIVCNADKWWKYERGCYAATQISESMANDLRQTVYINAYLDDQNYIFYSHNGVAESETRPEYLITAFGEIDNYKNLDAKSIVEIMNNGQPLRQTSFRPSESAMELLNLYHNQQKVSIIHGHNGIFDYSNPQVINLNARYGSSDSDFITAAIQLKK